MNEHEFKAILTSIMKTKLQLVEWKDLFGKIYNQLITYFSLDNQAIIEYFLNKVELVESRNQNMLAFLSGEINSDNESQNIISEYLLIAQDWREIDRFVTCFTKLLMGSRHLLFKIMNIQHTDGNPDPNIPEIQVSMSDEEAFSQLVGF